jgi:DUF1680 family protein
MAGPGDVSSVLPEPFFVERGISMSPSRSLVGGLGMLLAASLASAQSNQPTTQPSVRRDYPVQPVPFTAVHLDDAFWAPRIETNRSVTIPFAFEQCEKNGRMWNFERAAMALRGEAFADHKPSEFSFDDTDPYKVIEGASYALAVKPDPKLDAYLDKLIAQIAAAQEPDGYLYTARTIDPAHPHKWAGPERWVLERELSHELYNLGHLYEAAAAHYQATGKRNLLDVAIKTADLLDRTFGPGKQTIFAGHQIVEMGLVKLYRVTGDERYLNLAKFFLDAHRPDGHKGSGNEYNQSHKPVTEQTTAVGHAVRATYMYAGMADVAAIVGDAGYLKAIDTIWQDCVGTKLYITGGIGATAHGEAFGKAYELPNMTAYNETCAAIGNVYWNQRLFLLHADAKYVDVLERSLYNGVISGVSLDGRGFFYPNPLESKGQHSRSPWFGCACCPSNVCRFIASVPGYAYAQRGDELFVNLFAAGTAKLSLPDGVAVTLKQETRYPWDGKVRVTVGADATFTMKVRVPGWARNEPVPSDLYRFEGDAPAWTISVNGEPTQPSLDRGYAAIRRAWKAGDVVELDLPMPVRRVIAHDKVAADVGRVAVTRGPIVYCAEWPDVAGGKVRNLLLPDDATLSVDPRPDLLGGVIALRANAKSYAKSADGATTASDVEATLIPYYAWAHRGRGEMAVWFARDEKAVRPSAPPTIASTSKVTASRGAVDVANVNDGEPGQPLHWWPKKGTTEWVEYAFAEPERVGEASVRWFDDTGRGECRIPRGWRLFYKDTAAGADGAWRPVTLANGAAYGVAKGATNAVTFEPVTTTALRLAVDLPTDFSTGIEEWQVR